MSSAGREAGSIILFPDASKMIRAYHFLWDQSALVFVSIKNGFDDRMNWLVGVRVPVHVSQSVRSHSFELIAKLKDDLSRKREVCVCSP